MTDRSTKAVMLVPNHSLFRRGGEVVIESAEVELIRALQERHAPVRLASFVETASHTGLHGTVPPDVQIRALNWIRHRGAGPLRILNYIAAIVRAPAALRGVEQAYLFCPGHCTIVIALWAIVMRVPFGLYVRCTWLDASGRTPRLWRYIFSRAAFIVATGEAFRRRLQQFNDRVENEVPLTAVRVAAAADELQRRARGIRRLLFVGRLTAEKGILEVLDALAILRTEGVRDLTLRVVGGGTEQELESLRRRIRTLGLEHAVELSGHVGDAQTLIAYYHEADAFVFPSYFREGFPRVLYEAMMLAVPIVTTWMPGTDGFLRDGENALLCAPREPEDVARCIGMLVREPQLAVRLASRAQSDVRDVFAQFAHRSHAEQLLACIRAT
ncbi:MAG TPA: glycosyltransferase family 4 protein [Steroidobacteraceae bacterium]|nr:glycosyltransferase family 4 protein [Steroidobacteraceae bacterium]